MRKLICLLFCLLLLLLPMQAAAAEAEACPHSFSAWEDAGSCHSALCTLCGETVTASHQYEELWSADAQNHMHKCSLCGHATDAQAHSWPESWEGDSVNHIRLCTVCQVAGESRDHNWNSGKTVRIAGLFTNGRRRFTCTVCGYVRTDTLPAHKTLGIVLFCLTGAAALTAATVFTLRFIKKKRAKNP